MIADGAGWLAALVLGVTIVAPREFSHLVLLHGPVPVYPLDVTLVLLTAAALAAWHDRRTAVDRATVTGLMLPAGAWLAWGMVCAARGAAAGEAARSARDLAMNVYPLAILPGCWLAGRPGSGRLLATAFLAGCAALAVRGGVCALTAQDVFPDLPGYAPSVGRYLHGAEACFLTIGGLGLLVRPATGTRAGLRCGAAAVLFTLAVLGQQRSVFLALAVAAATVAILHPSRRGFLSRLAAAAAAALVASALLAAASGGARDDRPPPYRVFAEKFFGLVATPGQDTTVGFRRQAWAEAIARWRRSPMVGEGYGLPFGFDYHPADPGASPTMLAGSLALAAHGDIRPHNTYLTILYKSGLVGLLLFGLLAMRLTVAAGRRFAGAEPSTLNLAATGGVTLLAAFGLVNLMLESPYLALPFWGMVGAVLARTGADPKRRPP